MTNSRRQSQTTQAVLELIRSQPSTTTQQVRQRFDLDRGRASEILTRLTERGYARKVARGAHAPTTPPTTGLNRVAHGVVEFNAALSLYRTTPAAVHRNQPPPPPRQEGAHTRE